MREWLIKVAAILSYCGGPLILAEVLKPRLGVAAAFGVTFLPILLMTLGAPSLTEGGIWRWEGRLVRASIYGAWMSLVMHAYGAWILANAASHSADFGLYVLGLAVGIPVTVWYVISANRWLNRVGVPKNDTTPIEPG